MEKIITERLKEIEKKENIHILTAVESGSRAWGFSSPDSDYDVRFIYIRSEEDYLRLEPFRDVIELPPDGVLDINGWDLRKTLKLLYKSNPALAEWLFSPIVYAGDGFRQKLGSVMGDYFSPKRGVYHYLGMATGNYRKYLKGEMVRAKKYFYVLRPILACRWIIDKETSPPVRFSELADEELPKELRKDVKSLLDLKINYPEMKEIKRIDKINEYIESSIISIRCNINYFDDSQKPDWKRLNDFFVSELQYRY